MKYETLYKRTKTGAIQRWAIEVEMNGHHATIVKTSGQLNGTSTIHKELITEGKNIGRSNETHPQAQALSQALSDWKKKHDEGYKTLKDLGIEAVQDPAWQGVRYHSLRGWTDLEVALQAMLPKFNSDATGNVLPMLAKSKNWTPSPKNKYPVQLEVKFDGNRTTIVLTKTETYALTRAGKPQNNLDHLLAILDREYPKAARNETMIFDGEVYKHGLPLEEINEAIKAFNENTPTLQFWMYDLPLLVDYPQSARSRWVADTVEFIDNYFFQHSLPVIANSDEEVTKYHDEVVYVGGYEGIMVKDLNGTYQQGQRSSFWRKLKEWEDNEYKVVGYNLGQRGAQDLKFICVTADGSEFEVTMNGSIAKKQKLVDQIEFYVGRDLTVKHKGYTKYGIPNHAKGKLFRDE